MMEVSMENTCCWMSYWCWCYLWKC